MPASLKMFSSKKHESDVSRELFVGEQESASSVGMRRLEDANVKANEDAKDKKEGAATSTNSTSSAGALLDDGTTVTKKKKFNVHFPKPFMTKDQIQNGGFIVYFLGKYINYVFLSFQIIKSMFIL